MKNLTKIFLIFLILAFLFSSCNSDSSGNSNFSKVSLIKDKDNCLSGEFSIDENGTKIRFLKGNLFYDSNTKKWSTEKNQYDYRTWSGKDSCTNGIQSETGTPSGNVGQFYWSKDTDKAVSLKYNNDGVTTSDLFFTDNLFTDCFVLSQNQFDYLLNSRTTPYSLGQIILKDGKAVRGIIILPDNWETPEGAEYNAGESEWSSNQYTEEQWIVMENAGAVFLPACSYRRDSEIRVYEDSATVGFYWTTTPNSSEEEYAFVFSFFQIPQIEGLPTRFAITSPYNDRKDGYSIRCVSYVK